MIGPFTDIQPVRKKFQPNDWAHFIVVLFTEGKAYPRYLCRMKPSHPRQFVPEFISAKHYRTLGGAQEAMLQVASILMEPKTKLTIMGLPMSSSIIGQSSMVSIQSLKVVRDEEEVLKPVVRGRKPSVKNDPSPTA